MFDFIVFVIVMFVKLFFVIEMDESALGIDVSAASIVVFMMMAGIFSK